MILFNDEKVVFDRSYNSVLPTIVMVFGGIIMALGGVMGLVVLTEMDDPSLLIVGLIFGGLLLILGNYLKTNCAFRLMVTTKRVAQDGPFNQYVSISLSHVSGVSVKGNQLHVSAAGTNIVVGIPDSVSVSRTIVGLTNRLQTESEYQQAAAAAPAPVAPGVPVAPGAPVAPVAPQVRKPSVEVVQCEQLPAGVCSECGRKHETIWKCIVKNGTKYQERKLCKFCIDYMKKQ